MNNEERAAKRQQAEAEAAAWKNDPRNGPTAAIFAKSWNKPQITPLSAREAKESSSD